MLTKRHRRSDRHRHIAALALGAGLAGCSAGPGPEPVFCYRTLADIDCYAQPDPGHDRQLVGVYLRDARQARDKVYWLHEAEARMSR